jgi:hypothetical protein
MLIENAVNCWNSLRAAAQQRISQDTARLVKKPADWPISSQAHDLWEGPETKDGASNFAARMIS